MRDANPKADQEEFKTIKSKIIDMLSEIRKVLEKEGHIAFAYVFGSYLRNPKYSNDVDIAVFPRGKIGPRYGQELALKIEREIKKPVDVLLLGGKPLAIVSEVLRSGKLVFSSDERARISFETKALDDILGFNELMKEFDKKRFERYGIG